MEEATEREGDKIGEKEHYEWRVSFSRAAETRVSDINIYNKILQNIHVLLLLIYVGTYGQSKSGAVFSVR